MWRVTDKWGNRIELTDERWRHILEYHWELRNCLDEVLSTVRTRRGDKMSSHQDRIKIFYDREADVLYVTRGDAEHTDYVEYADDVILRFHPETKKLIGFTLIDFSYHFANKESDISLPFNIDFHMSDAVDLFY